MTYLRKFMVLSCEEAGYGFKGKKPSGRSILELKGNDGKLSCWAQDVKPETLYTTWMLFSDGSRYAGMPLGAFSVDAKGKGEKRYTIGPVLGGRFTLTDCAAVVIMAAKASKPTGILCGYSDTAFNWKDRFYDGTMKDKQKPEPEMAADPPRLTKEELTALLPVEEEPAKEEAFIMVEPSAVPVEEKPVEEEASIIVEPSAVPVEEKPVEKEASIIVEPSAVPVEEKPVEEEASIIVEPSAVPVEEEQFIMVEPSSVPVEEEQFITTEPTPVPIEPKMPEAEPCLEEEYPSEIGLSTEDEFPIKAEIKPKSKSTKTKKAPKEEDIVQRFRESLATMDDNCNVTLGTIQTLFNQGTPVVPFKRQNRNAKWVKICITDDIPLPESIKDLTNEVLVLSGHTRFGHLLLGLIANTQKPQYVIGVPDIFNPESRTQARKLGFMQFKPSEFRPEHMDTAGEYGYWLMFINM